MRNLFFVAFLVVAACSSNDSTSADAASDAPANQIDSGGSGAACGGISAGRCEETEYCDYVGHTCGMADAAGSCSKRPDICPDLIEPVCGCDGTVYNNECLAQKAGADPSETRACDTPPDHTRCGYRFCKQTEDCKMSGTGAETTYTCQTR